jgi:fermentation-respiration switch protein FrsA (DUF1100 family)
VPAHRWILIGESLGSGVAVHQARCQADKGVAVGALILEAPFTDTGSVGQRAYWFLPVRWLIHDRYPNRDRIGGIEAPVLIVHGARDSTVPQAHGRALFEAAREPKQADWIEAAGHNDLHLHGAFETELRFVRQWFAESFS